MHTKTIGAIALAIMLVTTGVAVAAPGNAPDDAGPDDAPANNASVEQGETNATNVTTGDDGVTAEGADGPPEDVPSHVPDHVVQIHDLIRQHIADLLDGSLGEAISDVLAGGSAAENR